MMALRDEDDIVFGFINLRDRTEQRERADRQRLLMHELGHRMKNTLSVVQSIATQSLSNASSFEDLSVRPHDQTWSARRTVVLARDAPTGLVPTYELWIKRRGLWLRPLEDAEQFDEDKRS
ncbi:HWE histidine kinase domain-containing protein [Rhizobium herbae]